MSVVGSAVERVTDSPVISKDDLPLLLVPPGLFVFLAFMLSPVLYLVYLSFTSTEPATLFQGREQWVSLANCVTILSDGQFWSSMSVTWLFVVTSVALKVLVGFDIGLVVTDERVHDKRFMRALIIIPLGLPGIFIIAIWRGIFSLAESGLANQFFRMAGLDSIAWLSEHWMASLAYNVTEAWLVYPFTTIVTVSALQDVSKGFHEAAMIDGTGLFARFLRVTLPSIKHPVLFASILTAAASLQRLLIPYVFDREGPSRTNELLIVYGCRETFRFQKYSEGAAIILVTVAVIGVFMMLNVKKGQLAGGVDDT